MTTIPHLQPAQRQRYPEQLQRFIARLEQRLTRFVRRHLVALVALGAFNLILLYPVIFMGRVISPNDVFFNFDPWSVGHPVDVQNSLFNDPPTSYLTLMSMLKSDWRTFHWNPYIASGIPGFGSSASAVLSPFVLLPVLLLSLVAVYTGIVLMKLNVAYLFAYQWLREEQLGKRGAAIGAIVAAGAGVLSVRWLWQNTNAAALYPALLWLVLRAGRGRRTSIALTALIALAYALAGFPAAMAYGAWLAIAYLLFVLVRERRFPIRTLAFSAAAVLLGLLIAAPSVIPFAQFLTRTGYLAMREQASRTLFFPLSHFASFIHPDRLGNQADHNWLGDPALGTLNNYVEATIYVGIVALLLLPFSLFGRRARSRWFWLVIAAVIVTAMFGIGFVPRLLATLPGFKYSSLSRTALLLPLPLAYLAAAGSGTLLRLARRAMRRITRRGAATVITVLACTLALTTSTDLALFAARITPYLTPEAATIPATPVIRFLQSQPGEFRIAAFFNYLWPNSAELFRLEDVRSHFGSEAKYRALLQRIDPSCFNGTSTVLQFDSTKFNLHDPLVGMLGIRYFIEHKTIDIVKWSIFASTVPGVKEAGLMTMQPGTTLQRSVVVDAEPFWALELATSIEKQTAPQAALDVALLDGSRVVYARTFAPQDLTVLGKVYVPIRPYARLGKTLTLRITSHALELTLLRSERTTGSDAPIFYGRVTTPVIFDRELPDGRVFRNLAEVPRIHAVKRVRRMSDEELLARTDIDFADEAIITDRAETLPLPASNAGAIVNVISAEPARHIVETSAMKPFFLATSEKLTPELRVTIDGNDATPLEINTLFAGVTIPAGQHRVELTRRLARGWWPFAAAGAALWLALAIYELAMTRRIQRVHASI
jgi:hypothetical protein